MDDGGIFSASMNAKPMYDNFSSGALLEGQELGFWEHVVFVFENKIASMYINGIKVFEKTYGENVDFSLSNQNDLYIGKFSEYWYPFNGYMDNFRIYNRALNDSEIQSLYNQRK